MEKDSIKNVGAPDKISKSAFKLKELRGKKIKDDVKECRSSNAGKTQV